MRHNKCPLLTPTPPTNRALGPSTGLRGERASATHRSWLTLKWLAAPSAGAPFHPGLHLTCARDASPSNRHLLPWHRPQRQHQWCRCHHRHLHRWRQQRRRRLQRLWYRSRCHAVPLPNSQLSSQSFRACLPSRPSQLSPRSQLSLPSRRSLPSRERPNGGLPAEARTGLREALPRVSQSALRIAHGAEASPSRGLRSLPRRPLPRRPPRRPPPSRPPPSQPPPRSARRPPRPWLPLLRAWRRRSQ